jgi:hypothetical protein
MVKVDANENMKKGPMMANIELLEVWVSSVEANSVSEKANGVIRVASGLLELA